MPFRGIKNYIILGQKWSIKLFFRFYLIYRQQITWSQDVLLHFTLKSFWFVLTLTFEAIFDAIFFQVTFVQKKNPSLIDVELKSDFTDLQNIKHFTQIQFHYKLIFSPRRSNFTWRIQKLQEKATGPPIVWGGPWTLGSRVPIGRQGWKRDHWLVGIPKLPSESETRHAGSGREEYRILINNTPNRHQNGITHIHASSLLLCIHCSLSMWFSTQATPRTLEYGTVIKTLRERAQCKELILLRC